jgi:hypothetical protein
MIKLKFIILFLLLYLVGHTQIPGPTTNWYFGLNAGITFNSGSPVALTNGSLVTTEGCASISGPTGNLLFYTDGVTVWNNTHSVMSNGTGLMGHASSTQSAIIIQNPTISNIYYIFTTTADVGVNGVRYSEVNMNLAAGLGAITAVKNVLLQTPSCEKLTAVRHCNNRDIWVVTHDWNSNGFRTWLVTTTGVSPIPVVSNSGVVVNGISQSSFGQLKVNLDGNKLLAAYYGNTSGGVNRFEVYDFNNSTGVVSNNLLLASETGIYGCEFSPNGRIVYGGTNQGRLIQYNLCAGNTAAIQASRYVIGDLGPFIGSIQLGPDGKIYVSRSTTSLSVINNPNIVGVGCGFVNAAISLAGRTSRMGLPNFVSFYVQPQYILPDPIISCTVVSFQSPSIINNCINQNNLYTYFWNFGDNQTSTQQNPTHTYLLIGTYNVSLTINGPCTSTTINKTINIPNVITISVYTN